MILLVGYDFLSHSEGLSNFFFILNMLPPPQMALQMVEMPGTQNWTWLFLSFY